MSASIDYEDRAIVADLELAESRALLHELDAAQYASARAARAAEPGIDGRAARATAYEIAELAEDERWAALTRHADREAGS